MPQVLIPLAQGCEELEAVTLIDILRRAGIMVVTAGLDPGPVVASRGVRLIPDIPLDEALGQEFDMVVLPGGAAGVEHLDRDPRIRDLLSKMAQSGRLIAAICAAPKVLANAGLLRGRKATGYPGILDQMGLQEVTLSQEAIVKDGNLITSRGPGTAMDLALTLVENLMGKEKKDEVERALVREDAV